MLKNKGQFKGALVIAPLRPVYSVWPPERDKWEEFKDFSVGILHDDDKEEVLFADHDFYVMNFEGIEWLFGTEPPKKPKKNAMNATEFKRRMAEYELKYKAWKEEDKRVKARLKELFSKVDVLIIDELSKMKHHDTKRFKSIKKWLGRFARRWGLTGSPAPNGLMDLFGQCYVIDLGRALGPYITHYRTKYFHPTGFGGYTWKLNEGAEKQIYKAIKPLALRMDADDYIKMPKLIQVPVYVDLPPKARKMYDEMEEELFASLDDEDFMAVNAASASIKCEQIANGALYKDRVDLLTGLPIRGKREWAQIHTAKLDAMADLIEELQGQPILFGYHFGHDLERIIKLLGKNTPHSDVSPKVFEQLKQKWNRNELAYMFGHPASMGHGINMQEGDAHNVGWFHIPWDFEQYDQFIRRIRRQGNNANHVFVHHIVARDTVDEAKMAALQSKGSTQKSLLDALKTYRKQRG